MDRDAPRIMTDAPYPLREPPPAPTRARSGRRPGFAGWSLLGWALLAIAGWWFIIWDGGSFTELISPETWERLTRFVGRLAGSDTQGAPAFLRGDSWREALDLAGDTLVMSVLAAGMAGIGALLTVAFAASNLTHGDLAPASPLVGRVFFFSMRGFYILTRAVPELIWAMLVVFVLSPGIIAGAVALGVHNLGVLGRLGAEVVEDIDPRPVRALRSSGAGNVQTLFYGVLPQVLPQLVTFLLYRWEVIIRTTAVVGFVAAAGLGYELRLDMSFFRYSEVGLALVVYILTVWAIDLASTGLRRLAR